MKNGRFGAFSGLDDVYPQPAAGNRLAPCSGALATPSGADR